MIKKRSRNNRGVPTKYMNHYNASFSFTQSYVNIYADVKNKAVLQSGYMQ